MAESFAKERKIAENAVFRAALLTKKIQSLVKELPKADATPVTVADFAAQALLISALRGVFPNDAFLGEEDCSALRKDAELRDCVYELVCSAGADGGMELAMPSSAEDMMDMIDFGGAGQGGPMGRFWVMDPIDGTATFLLGQQYAVSLALIENGKEVVGVLACPSLRVTDDGRVDEKSVDEDGLGVMLTAVKGQGATARYFPPSANARDGLTPAQPLSRLSSCTDLSNLHLIDSQKSKSARHDLPQKLAEKIGAKYPGTDIWSSHIRYAALILGGGDVWLRIPTHADAVFYIWDNAGAQLVFTELGGKITDLDGKETDFGAGRELKGNRGMIAAREGVYDEVFTRITKLINQDK
jgi:3'(2'), 5'-bisphosphate nucleotidase